MTDLFSRYSEKLIRAGLAEMEAPLLGTGEELPAGDRRNAADPAIAMPGSGKALYVWNREDPLAGLLTRVGERLGRRAVLCSQPAEPYRTMLLHLMKTADGGVIQPQDFETRLFLTDLPLLADLDEAGLLIALKDRRCVIIPGGGVVATAKRDMEAAFVIYSSACFAIFVKFFSDLLRQRQQPGLPRPGRAVLETIMGRLDPGPPGGREAPALSCGPWEDEGDIRAAMAATGRKTVSDRLVDANFGNISYRRGDDLFITRKGSALDDLGDKIVRVPLAGPAETDATASTELPAHRLIVRTAPYRAVLHGHPKFAVIMSMDCGEADCPDRGGCHRFCPRERWVRDIPVVSGEAGAGNFGLCNTVPAAVRDRGAAIVYGHGVFTAGKDDFRAAFERLSQVEETCKQLFFETIAEA